MSEDRYTRMTLRIPKDLHKKLVENAELRSKSTNAEIVARLEESFNPATAIPEDFERLYKLQKEIIDEKDKTTNKLEKMVKTLLNEVEETKKVFNEYEEFVRMPKTNHK